MQNDTTNIQQRRVNLNDGHDQQQPQQQTQSNVFTQSIATSVGSYVILSFYLKWYRLLKDKRNFLERFLQQEKKRLNKHWTSIRISIISDLTLKWNLKKFLTGLLIRLFLFIIQIMYILGIFSASIYYTMNIKIIF